MKRRRSLFLHLGQLKLLAKKFVLVILFLATIVLMVLNKNNSPTLSKSSDVALNVVAPVISVLVVPAKFLAQSYDYFSELKQIKQDNKLLREENRRLRVLRDEYKALQIENRLLAKLLNYVPLPETEFISARVIAEENDAFVHSMVAYIADKNVSKGDVVLSDQGVVGRVEKVARNYVKIILITDINSKIPVMIQKTRVRGILSGDNTMMPMLIFTPLDAEVNIGDRVVTSGVSGVFPAGLPIGEVVSVSKNEIRVKPFASREKLEYIKIVKYGIGGLLESEERSLK